MTSKIKICGLFRERDIALVNEAAPDYIGFVFAPSRRQVSEQEAAGLRRNLKEGIIPVGVFVQAPPERIASLYRRGIIAIAQLHGGEDASYIRGLKSLCPIGVIKVFSLGGPRIEGEGWKTAGADYLLFDSGPGGTGSSFDWSFLHPGEIPAPWFLAGGINAATIKDALALNPYGVDLSSGAETQGLKDRDKIIHLVQQVRNHGKEEH